MKTTSLMAQGYLCNIYLLDANIYLLDVKTCESLTAKIHAQLWCGNVGIPTKLDSPGELISIAIPGSEVGHNSLIVQWRPLVPVSPKHSHPGSAMA